MMLIAFPHITSRHITALLSPVTGRVGTPLMDFGCTKCFHCEPHLAVTREREGERERERDREREREGEREKQREREKGGRDTDGERDRGTLLCRVKFWWIGVWL